MILDYEFLIDFYYYIWYWYVISILLFISFLILDPLSFMEWLRVCDLAPIQKQTVLIGIFFFFFLSSST